jgi:hypothetical protein
MAWSRLFSVIDATSPKYYEVNLIEAIAQLPIEKIDTIKRKTKLRSESGAGIDRVFVQEYVAKMRKKMTELEQTGLIDTHRAAYEVVFFLNRRLSEVLESFSS